MDISESWKISSSFDLTGTCKSEHLLRSSAGFLSWRDASIACPREFFVIFISKKINDLKWPIISLNINEVKRSISFYFSLSLTRICASSPSPSHLNRHCQDGSAETHVRRWRPLVRRHSRRLCWYLLYGSWRHAARQFKRFFLGDQEKGQCTVVPNLLKSGW